jgi:predicted Zn-dependent protease
VGASAGGWDGLRKVLALEKDGKSAPRAVSEVLDSPWTKVQKAWKAHLKTIDLSAGKAVGKGDGKRIRFDKGGKRADDNVGVDAVANAKARKHARIGGMLRARAMLDAAAIEYEKALALAPGDAFVSGKLARTYVELGKYTEAIELVRPLVADNDQDPGLEVTLGVALAANADPQGASGAFEAAERISPFDPAVRCGLADAYGKIGDARAKREADACDTVKQP